MNAAYHARRLALSHGTEQLLRLRAWRTRDAAQPPAEPRPARPETPEDFRPLENACFQDPYEFYRLLRDQYPVYQLPNGIFCISRYDDIRALTSQPEIFSSKHQGAMLRLSPGQSIAEASTRLDAMGRMGVIPSDVLATADQPAHTAQRHAMQRTLKRDFIQSLEPDVTRLCNELMAPFIDTGQVEFMREFAWQLPMRMVVRLLDLPASDLPRIKHWCLQSIGLLSGSTSRAQLTRCGADSLAFFRYCWRQFLAAKRHPPAGGLMRMLVDSAHSPDGAYSDALAVSVIHQLLIAGSDSSATTLGNAVRMLAENPDLEAELRANPDRIAPFIEEVLRLESAFRGHFRWTKSDFELHGVAMPRGSRVFMMWASGNRDERAWPDPDRIILDRPDARRHLTFGHWIHACVGRELARLEIRVALRELLRRTRDLRVAGPAPYVASMFVRSLVQLPLRFESAHNARSEPTEAAA